MSDPKVLSEEELGQIRAGYCGWCDVANAPQTIRRLIATVDALKAENEELRKRAARIDDVREIMAMDFEKVREDDEELMRITITYDLWKALVDNMEPFSKGDMTARKCWPRSVWQEFRDDQVQTDLDEALDVIEGSPCWCIDGPCKCERDPILRKHGRLPEKE